MKIQIDDKEFEIKSGSKAERKVNNLLKCLEYWSGDQIYKELMVCQSHLDQMKNKRTNLRNKLPNTDTLLDKIKGLSLDEFLKLKQQIREYEQLNKEVEKKEMEFVVLYQKFHSNFIKKITIRKGEY